MTDTVLIGATTYDVYDSYDDVAAYLGGSFSAWATAWLAASTENQKRAMVEVTRRFNAIPWQGALADDPQDLAWPRSGLTYADGTVVDDTDIPQQVLDAFAEMSACILQDVTAQTAANVAAGTRRLKAGSVEIEYFAPSVFDEFVSPYPDIVRDLIGRWFASSAAIAALAGGNAYGADCSSQFTRRAFGFVHGE